MSDVVGWIGVLRGDGQHSAKIICALQAGNARSAKIICAASRGVETLVARSGSDQQKIDVRGLLRRRWPLLPSDRDALPEERRPSWEDAPEQRQPAGIPRPAQRGGVSTPPSSGQSRPPCTASRG